MDITRENAKDHCRTCLKLLKVNVVTYSEADLLPKNLTPARKLYHRQITHELSNFIQTISGGQEIRRFGSDFYPQYICEGCHVKLTQYRDFHYLICSTAKFLNELLEDDYVETVDDKGLMVKTEQMEHYLVTEINQEQLENESLIIKSEPPADYLEIQMGHSTDPDGSEMITGIDNEYECQEQYLDKSQIMNVAGYKKISDRGVKNVSALLEAIKEVKIQHKKPFSVAASYGIAYNSLKRYIQRFERRVPDISQATDDELMRLVSEISSSGAPTVFTSEEEAALVNYLIKSSKFYYGVSVEELRKMAFQFAKKINVSYPDSWNANHMTGKDWYYGFAKRYPYLLMRSPEQTSLKRVKSFCREKVNLFFHELQQLFAEYKFPPENIWNMDEKGLSNEPSKVGKVMSVLELKKAPITAPQERGTFLTMALAVNAMGGFIPPFFVFPQQQEELRSFMEHFIKFTKASKNQPNLVLLGNHSTHLSIEAMDVAFEHGIVLFSFPPNCSHKMQPLDVSVYGSVATFYKSQCAMWSQDNGGQLLEIHHIPELIDRALNLALTPANIKAGFRTTGIFPLNTDAFTDADFIATEYKQTLAKRIRGRGRATTATATTTMEPPAKLTKTTPTKNASPDENKNFCIICLLTLPPELGPNNSVECNTCKRPVHLLCAKTTASFFTCNLCDTALSE